MTNLQFNLRPGARILMFLLVSIVCLIGGAIVVAAITFKGLTTPSLRIATIAQDLLMFILPAILTAVIVTRQPATLLRVDSRYPWLTVLLATAALLAAMPAMNALVAWNESLTLPASLAGVEQWMRNSENAAQGAVSILMGGTSWPDLIISVLIVGILAGFSEEIFFRGALLRLLATMGPRRNLTIHMAVWGTAIIFSAFHVQFFGFFPRLLLGAYFGYLLWWSRSLWVPVTVHAINNTIVVVTSWLHRAGHISTDVNSAGADNIPAIFISIILTSAIIYLLHRRSIR